MREMVSHLLFCDYYYFLIYSPLVFSHLFHIITI
eukprot:UN19659